MTHNGPSELAKCAITDLRIARADGGDWSVDQISTLRRAVNILLGQPGHFIDEGAIHDKLMRAKTLARASYVDSHAHSTLCYTGVTRATIINFVQGQANIDHYRIACLIRKHFTPFGNTIDALEYKAWLNGLFNIGHRGKLIAAMKPGSLTRGLLEEIHTEINDFLAWTTHLDRYLLH